MDLKQLPPHPSLEQYEKQAKELLGAFRALDIESVRRIKAVRPRLRTLSEPELLETDVTLSERRHF